MSLLNSSAVFSVVSASVSVFSAASMAGAGSTAFVLAQTVILADKAPLSVDAVGFGTRRMLVYPTGDLPSPLIYEQNPHRWTNLGPEAFVRPIYTQRRTLGTTVTQQSLADVTDLEYTEEWVGGGADRIAMSWRFFSQLYTYYMNPPDVTKSLFIQWRARDITTRAYNVFLTSLSVGGGAATALDHRYKAGEGWITENVVLRFRILSQVS